MTPEEFETRKREAIHLHGGERFYPEAPGHYWLYNIDQDFLVELFFDGIQPGHPADSGFSEIIYRNPEKPDHNL